ncbi:hypothetical protein L6R52_01805 [Myxococcota bacterium]|nr:hypothetical protein [Myxococcota bacterium]
MKLKSFFRIAAVWLVAITGLHLWLNFDWSAMINDYLPIEQKKLNVAFIPVT